MKLTVIGGGPGGYEAAIAAAKLGAEVVLIEKDEVGGICLNRGCIPTKSLIASYDVYKTVEEAKKFGILTSGEVHADYNAIIARKDKVSASLTKGIHYLLEKNNVSYLNGFGKLVDRNTIKVTKEDGTAETITTDYVILATGSVSVCPGMFHCDGKTVITSDDLLAMTEVPESIIIVGGGVIGCEIGQFLNKMGTDVTIVEMLPQILVNMDTDIANQVAKQFKREKIKTITEDGIAEVISNEKGVSAKLMSGKELTARYMLVAIGRRPFTEGLGLEQVDIDLSEGGHVNVNKYLQTSTDNIYAVGDILDTPMLAHVAAKEGLTAVKNIVYGNRETMAYHAVPACVYTNPEVASVGVTEAELKRSDRSYRIGTFDFKALGKAQASGDIAGFVKVITDENDVIIGSAIAGAHAADMISILTTAVLLGLTSKQLGDCMFPHPTMSEAIMEALHDLHGASIHKA